MRNYPKINRNIEDRKDYITDENRTRARLFGKVFFDEERKYGYGGYKYDGRWVQVVKVFYSLENLEKTFEDLETGKFLRPIIRF